MTTKLNINQWSETDRPREKMLASGAQALSNAELFSVIIGSGSTKCNAVDLMKNVLSDCGNNLHALGRMKVSDLCRYHGLGEAKALNILAVCELAKRRQAEKVQENKCLRRPCDIWQYMLPYMEDLDVEQAWVLLMNNSYRLIATKRISTGGITETAVDIRLVLKEALLNNATVVVLCHNHPSDNPLASTDDDRLTARVKKSCELMRIYLADHVIITRDGYYSYRERDRL